MDLAAMGCGSSLQGQGQPKGQGKGQPSKGKRGGRASVIEAEAGLACLEINAFSEKKRRQSMKSMQSDASMAAVIPSEKASSSKPSKSPRAKQRAAVDVDESAEAAGHLPGCPQYPTDHAELEPQLRLENC